MFLLYNRLAIAHLVPQVFVVDTGFACTSPAFHTVGLQSTAYTPVD